MFSCSKILNERVYYKQPKNALILSCWVNYSTPLKNDRSCLFFQWEEAGQQTGKAFFQAISQPVEHLQAWSCSQPTEHARGRTDGCGSAVCTERFPCKEYSTLTWHTPGKKNNCQRYQMNWGGGGIKPRLIAKSNKIWLKGKSMT